MRAVIQRVKCARVLVENKTVGEIDKGLLILLAIHKEDEEYQIKKMADKIIGLRIFEDNDSKMNLSLKDVQGDILLVSQFTLYGDVSRGKRPSFIESARPEKAIDFYEKLQKYLSEQNINVKTGKFRSYMDVQLTNDGPTTLILDL